MFQIGNARGIIKYILVCALTLSSECQAAVNKVQSWGDDDNIYFFTTRRPYIWNWFTDDVPPIPTFNPPPDYFEVEGARTLFFAVLFISIAIISFIAYLCKRHLYKKWQVTRQVPGATVHPPPTMSAPTVYPSGAPTHAYSSGNARPLLAFTNMGYGSSAIDVPPDYATVAIADLTEAQKYNFPIVVPKMDSPPPKYEEGYTVPFP